MLGRELNWPKGHRIEKTIREVLQKEVTSFGTGAHVICPKEHLGRKVYLVVCEE